MGRWFGHVPALDPIVKFTRPASPDLIRTRTVIFTEKARLSRCNRVRNARRADQQLRDFLFVFFLQQNRIQSKLRSYLDKYLLIILRSFILIFSQLNTLRQRFSDFKPLSFRQALKTGVYYGVICSCYEIYRSQNLRNMTNSENVQSDSFYHPNSASM